MMATAPGKKAVKITISGLVQGVGFRAWMVRQAEARGLSGWVRNRLNGDVEALIAGSAEAVDALCAACRQGPPAAQVDNVQVVQADAAALEADGKPRGFRAVATR